MSGAAQAGTGPRVVVGSGNPIKVAAVRQVVAAWIPDARVDGVNVPSGVPDQPWSDEETLQGAEARAAAAVAAGGEIGVGIESGVAWTAGRLYGFTWAAVRHHDGRTGRGCSARFAVPPAVARELQAGAELDAAMHRVTGAEALGRGEGAMGLITAGHVTRQEAACHALHFALAAVLRPELYRDGESSPGPTAR